MITSAISSPAAPCTSPPTDLTNTSAFIFFTRWSTHFCAPVFILTAGIGAALWKQRGHHSKSELFAFLVTRGLWLILVEFTFIRLIMFSQLSYRAQPTLLLILWAIGVSMIVLALLQLLPLPWLALVSASIILLHNLLDPIRASSLGRSAPLWYILHAPGVFLLGRVPFLSAYPVLPWIGVIGLGYCLAQISPGTNLAASAF